MSDKHLLEYPGRGPGDMLEWAWGIIANAGHGDWSKESKDWQTAAGTWRDAYFKGLGDGRSEAGSEDSGYQDAVRAIRGLDYPEPTGRVPIEADGPGGGESAIPREGGGGGMAEAPAKDTAGSLDNPAQAYGAYQVWYSRQHFTRPGYCSECGRPWAELTVREHYFAFHYRRSAPSYTKAEPGLGLPGLGLRSGERDRQRDRGEAASPQVGPIDYGRIPDKEVRAAQGHPADIAREAASGLIGTLGADPAFQERYIKGKWVEPDPRFGGFKTPKGDRLDALSKERSQVYGDPRASHQAIGLAWEGLFRNRYQGDVYLVPTGPEGPMRTLVKLGHMFPDELVALFLSAFKEVRAARPVYRADSYDDAHVYLLYSEEWRK